MFCSRCGNPDQTPNTYCRSCGTFLPDIDKSGKRKQTPEDHFRANLVLSGMTIVASLTLSALLFIVLAFRPGTHPLIYVTAGFLIAMAAWQIQTFVRSWKLRKHFSGKNAVAADEAGPPAIEGVLTGRFLEEGKELVPASVTERTTTLLGDKVPR